MKLITALLLGILSLAALAFPGADGVYHGTGHLARANGFNTPYSVSLTLDRAHDLASTHYAIPDQPEYTLTYGLVTVDQSTFHMTVGGAIAGTGTCNENTCGIELDYDQPGFGHQRISLTQVYVGNQIFVSGYNHTSQTLYSETLTLVR